MNIGTERETIIVEPLDVPIQVPVREPEPAEPKRTEPERVA